MKLLGALATAAVVCVSGPAPAAQPDAVLIRAAPAVDLPPTDEGVRLARARAEASWQGAAAPGAPAEALVELARAYQDHAQLAYRQAWVAYGACERARGCQPTPSLPEPDYRLAVRWYREVLARHPGYVDAAGAMIALADLLAEPGPAHDPRAALALRLNAAQAAPHHTLAAANALAIGEHFFAAAQLAQARRWYERVLSVASPADPLTAYAVYKLAWVQFDLTDFAAAVDAFKAARRAASGPQREIFVRQIDADLTLAWAQAEDGWRTAERFFTAAADAARAHQQLLRMADLYEAAGRLRAAAAVLHHLLAADGPPAERARLERDLVRVQRALTGL